MKTNDPRDNLPASVAQTLRAIQRRARAITLIQGLALTGAVLIAAMLAAMLIDLAVGWLDPAARYTVTAFALAGAAAVAVISCALPLLRRRTIVNTAREVEQTMPQLEERWSSVTEFAQSSDAPEVRGSETMIRKVASEAEAAGAIIRPKLIVSARPAVNAGRWLAAAAAMLVAMLAMNFAQAGTLLHRFWKPGDNVSLTEVRATPADTWVAKGEPLSIMAALKGRLPKEAPRLSLRGESGTAKEVTMAATGERTSANFQHSIPEVADSFDYRVRGGDGQTPWHRITAVDRPEITAVKLTISPPAYSHLAGEKKDSLPNAVRVLHGTQIAVAFKSSQPLDKMLLDLGDGQSRQLTAQADNWYDCSFAADENVTFSALAENKYQLQNKHKPSCSISVYEDLPPSVKVLSPSDEIAVTPTEKVNITFEAKDDFGLAKAEVIVTTTTAEGVKKTQTLPVDLKEDQGKKQVKQSIQLDPKELGLKHGDQLSYVVQVTDTKQNPAQAAGESPALAKAAEPKEAIPEAGKAEDKENDKSNDATAENPSTLLAKAAPPEEAKSAKGSQRPPDDMTRRMLDAGQCTACKPRNISIDEWAGTFEGEKRKKLEIAIAPVLAQLDELLRVAEEKTAALQVAASTPAGLQAEHEAPLSEASAKVGESETVIAGFKNKTGGTPYAFVGLQLQNIGSAPVTPAHRKLELAVIPVSPPAANVEPLQQASFHLGRAREMLADLTRTFEKVKRDQAIADAMQKLAKMHQLFIEDTQALLGSSKSPINSYNRKIAEVDDEFVDKLKAMLEEKKKILAELSKLLAEDPRLLRRFLAMQQLQSTTYRDQMTLLAERQKEVQQQVAKWNGTPEADRPALLPQIQASYAARQGKIAQDAAALRENMETWLPLDVKPDEPKVAEALSQAEKIVQTMTESSAATADESAEAAVKQLRAFRPTVSELSSMRSKDKPRMTAYIANRLSEIETLINAEAHQGAIAAFLQQGDFAKAAAVSQDAITSETSVLGEKLTASGKQVARLSDEIAEKAEQLEKIVQSDILPPQGKSVAQLAEKNTGGAAESLDAIVPAFALGETTFDEMMRLIIAKLDEAPAPSAPGEAPQMDDIMAMLQNEMKASESLGIPCRPTNVTVVSDWMKPGNGQGMGLGQAQAKAAQAQAQQAKADAERLEKQARESAAAALAAAKKPQPVENATAADRAVSRTAAWNKLASKLQKDLLQGRDSTAPEQYRAAIENYFKSISEVTPPVAP